MSCLYMKCHLFGFRFEGNYYNLPLTKGRILTGEAKEIVDNAPLTNDGFLIADLPTG